TLIVADIELPNVFCLGAVLTFRFDIDLPLAPEAVEVVDEISPHEGLNRTIYIVEVHPLLQDFVAVYFDKFLWDTRQKSGAEGADFRPLSGSFKKNTQVFGEELNIAARTVFENECKSAGSADAWNGGRGKTEGNCCWQPAQLLVEMCFERLKLLSSRLALAPRLEGHKKARVVTNGSKTEQTEAEEAGN